MSKEKELKMKNKKLNVVELFSGIGSQAKALENININFETVNTCEWDIHALVAYNLIHNDGALHSGSLGLTKLELLNELNKYNLSGDCKNPINKKYLSSLPEETLRQIYSSILNTGNLIDIKSLTGDMLPKDVDIMTYSFPCQDLSNVGAFHGYNKGIDRDANNRSGLLWQVERILNERIKLGLPLPKSLVLENVATLLSERHKHNFQEWQDILVKLGYYNKIYTLNAKDFGAAQNRKRLIMISFLTNFDQKFNKKLDAYFSEHNLEDMSYVNSLNIHKDSLKQILKVDYSNVIYLQEALESQPNDTKSRRDIWNDNVKLIDANNQYIERDFAATLTTKQDRHPNSGNIYFDIDNGKSKFRYITPRESFMLMGFDENDFDKVNNISLKGRGDSKFFTRDILLHLAGNSIVVNVLEQIFKQIINILKLL